jgi:hypothetical protein
LPEPVAAFVGVWAGRWHSFVNMSGGGDAGLDETLIVENIMPLTDSTYQAYVIRSWAGNLTRKSGFVRTTGVIGEDGILHMGAITGSMAENRQNLYIEYRGISSFNTMSFRMTGILWRTRLP